MKIFYINQIGTTNYLLPLFYFLKKKNISFLLIIQKKAFISEISKFNYLKITQRYKIENHFQSILKKEPSHIVLSATGDLNERKLILLAKKNKIKSTSIIDVWSNYRERFLHNKKLFLPDKILCIDTKNITEMKKLNFPISKLQIIGNPFLEKFFDINVNEGKNILFISQPISSRVRKTNYNEFDFYDLIKKLLDYKKINHPFHLLLHPEEKGNFNFLKKYFKGYNIKVFSKNKLNHNNYFLVVGMFSTEIIKYYIMRKKVIIFDLDKKNHRSPLARWKLSPVVKNEEELYTQIFNKKKIKKNINKNFLGLKGSLKRLIKYMQ